MKRIDTELITRYILSEDKLSFINSLSPLSSEYKYFWLINKITADEINESVKTTIDDLEGVENLQEDVLYFKYKCLLKEMLKNRDEPAKLKTLLDELIKLETSFTCDFTMTGTSTVSNVSSLVKDDTCSRIPEEEFRVRSLDHVLDQKYKLTKIEDMTDIESDFLFKIDFEKLESHPVESYKTIFNSLDSNLMFFPNIVDVLVTANVKFRNNPLWSVEKYLLNLTIEQQYDFLRKIDFNMSLEFIYQRLLSYYQVELTFVAKRDRFASELDKLSSFKTTLLLINPKFAIFINQIYVLMLRYDHKLRKFNKELFVEYLNNLNVITKSTNVNKGGRATFEEEDKYYAHFLLNSSSMDDFKSFATVQRLSQILSIAKLTKGISLTKSETTMSNEQIELLKNQKILKVVKKYDLNESKAKDVVTLKIKNIKRLDISLYQINTIEYLKNSALKDYSDLNLEGFDKTQTFSHSYDANAFVIQEISFEFEKIRNATRGVFLLQFNGDDQITKVLIRKGCLTLQCDPQTHRKLRVLNESGSVCTTDTSVHLNDLIFEPQNDKGEVFVPFNINVTSQKVILCHQGFADVYNYQTKPFTSDFKFNILYNTESIVVNQECSFVVQSKLLVNNVAESLMYLKDTSVDICILGHNNEKTTITKSDVVLKDDRDLVIKVVFGFLPLSVTFDLKSSLKLNSDIVDVSKSQTISFRSTDSGNIVTGYVHLNNKKQIVVSFLGENGEKMPNVNSTCLIKFVHLTRPVEFALKSDANGLVCLDNSDLIQWFTMQAEGVNVFYTNDTTNTLGYNQTYFLSEDETLKLDIGATDQVSLFSLYEEMVHREVKEGVETGEGVVKIANLEIGNYVLCIGRKTKISIVVVRSGFKHNSYLISKDELVTKDRIVNAINVKVDVDKEVNVRVLDQGLRNVRMHLFGVNFETSSVENLQSSLRSLETPSNEYEFVKINQSPSLYFNQTTESFELMYIKHRKAEKSYIGTTIQKPKLIINPSKTSKVINNKDSDAVSFPGADTYSKKMGCPMQARCFANKLESCPVPFVSNKLVGFLKNKGALLTNIVPDTESNMKVPLENLKKFQKVFAIVTDGLTSRFVHLYSQEREVELVDCRLKCSHELDLVTEFDRRILRCVSGHETRLPISKSNIYVFDNISKLSKYLMSNLSNDSKSNLRDFAFVVSWSGLSLKEKLMKYDKHRCDEVNFFLYFKDRLFFDEVIKPFLVFKSCKNIIDMFLLGEYQELERFATFELINSLTNIELLLVSFACVIQNNRFAKHVLEYFDNKMNLATISDESRNNVIDKILNLNNSENQNVASDEMYCLDEINLEGAECDQEEEYASNCERAYVKETQSKSMNRNLCFGGPLAPKVKIIERSPTVNEYIEKGYHFKSSVDNYNLLSDALRHFSEFRSMKDFLSDSVFFSANDEAHFFFTLSLMDVPLEMAEYEIGVDCGDYVVSCKSNSMVVYKIQNNLRTTFEESAIICSQKIVDQADKYLYDDKNPNVKIEKFVKEFVIKKVYSLKIVVTNTSSVEQSMTLIYEVPSGAIVLDETDFLISKTFVSYPLQSQVFMVSFYFPEEGSFTLYPATIVHCTKIICQCAAIGPIVVQKSKSTIDNNTINDVINSGDLSQIINFIKTKNIYNGNIFSPTSLTLLLRNKDCYLKIIEALQERFYFNDYIWSFGVYHQIYSVAIVFLLNRFSSKEYFKLEIRGEVLEVVPKYQLKEYSPLINARAHSFLESRNSGNDFEIYVQNFLKYMAYSCSSSINDNICLINCFINQDKNDLAVSLFKKLKSRVEEVHFGSIQFDYLCAYIDFIECKDGFKLAKSICEKYILYPVIYWRNLFIDMINQISEFEESSKLDFNESVPESTNSKGLNTPSMTASLKDSSIEIVSQFINKVSISYFKFDAEVLFSLDPFISQNKNIKPSTLPFHVDDITLDSLSANQNYFHDIPTHLLNYNLFILVQSHTSSYSQSFQFAYKPFNMLLQVNERLGIIKVMNKADRKPLSKTYVKCYTKDKSDKVSFYKDGYTDIRGSFDYISLNVDKLKSISLFALLIFSEEFGSKDIICSPPVDYNEVKEGISELISTSWKHKQQSKVNQNSNIFQNVM